MSSDQKIRDRIARIEKGGAPKYHEKNLEQGKLFARKRIELLLDADSFLEDAALANALDPELPADGVITGSGTLEGRTGDKAAPDAVGDLVRAEPPE